MPTVAQRLNNLLAAWLDVHIVRGPSPVEPARPHYLPTKPLSIDLIGGSGVGKSTLYAELLRNRGDRWLSPGEIMRNAADPLGDRHVPADQLPLIQAKLDAIRDADYSAWTKMQLIGFFGRNMHQELQISALNKDATVLYEDGIIHNFSAELEALHGTDPEAFRKLVAGRAVVHCHLDPTENARRIQQREEAIGQVRPQHQVDSFAELVAVAARTAAERQRLAGLLAATGVPVLHLSTSASVEGNVREVNAFIARVQAGHGAAPDLPAARP